MQSQLCDFVKHLDDVSIATRIRNTLSRGETWAICAGQEGASSGHPLFHHGLDRPGLPMRPTYKNFPSQNSALHCWQLFSKKLIFILCIHLLHFKRTNKYDPLSSRSDVPLWIRLKPLSACFVANIMSNWTVRHIFITSRGCSQCNSYVTLKMGIWQ